MLLDIPYLFSSSPAAWRAMDGWFGKELADDMLRETGLRNLFFGETGFRNFTSSARPIKSPADLRGLKIRVMESPIYITLVKSLGAAATPMPGSEMYTAMQQKVVDGQENPVSVIVQYKMYEVQKYVCLDGHTYGCDFWVINEKFFQTLPKETQAIVKQGAILAGTVNRGMQTLLSVMGLATLKEKGMEIYAPTPKEKAMFREASQKPVLEYIEKQVGKTWVEKVLKAAKEAEASLPK
jgi:TRAP-type transport system periplasmic protein